LVLREIDVELLAQGAFDLAHSVMPSHVFLVLLVLDSAAEMEYHEFALPLVHKSAVQEAILYVSSFALDPEDAVEGGLYGSDLFIRHGGDGLLQTEGAEGTVEGQRELPCLLPTSYLLVVLLDGAYYLSL